MSPPEIQTQEGTDVQNKVLAFIGGTGPQGRGLAFRFATAGYEVVIGSRSKERASATAAEIAERVGRRATGAVNHDACVKAEIIVLAVPYDGHAELIRALVPVLANKIVVSCVNPLGFDQLGPFGLEVRESAAEEAQRLAPEARLVGAFHHLSAVKLWRSGEKLPEEDVLVCGDDDEAKAIVSHLAAHVTGRRGVDAGRLRIARQLEPLTAVLISINKRYKVNSGIRITGLPSLPHA